MAPGCCLDAGMASQSLVMDTAAWLAAHALVVPECMLRLTATWCCNCTACFTKLALLVPSPHVIKPCLHASVVTVSQIYSRRRGRAAAGHVSIPALRPEVVLSTLTDMGFDAAAAQSVLSRVGPSLDLAVQMLLGGSAGGAPAAAAAGSAGGAAADAAAGQQGDAAQRSRRSPTPAAAAGDAAGNSPGQQGDAAGSDEGASEQPAARVRSSELTEGEFETGEEEDEDEYEDGDEDEDEDEVSIVSLSHPC